MDKTYYEAVDKMEKMNVSREYQLGWMGGYLGNPEREEQRTNDVYEAGYEDGGSRSTDNFDAWANK